MDLLIILIFWIMPVALGTFIGSKKGEAVISFILLVFLGWIWFPFVVMSRGKRKRCLSCYEWIHKKANICSHCNTKQ